MTPHILTFDKFNVRITSEWQIVHEPRCTNNPCTCGLSNSVVLKAVGTIEALKAEKAK